jgi:REP element-mobilizing transposase RayT
MPEPKTHWPHAPTHQLSQRGTYFVTGATYQKAQHFRGADRLRVLQRGLLTVADKFGWQLEAWAVFSNHYHFVAHSPPAAEDAASLDAMLRMLHVKLAGWRTPRRFAHAGAAAFAPAFWSAAALRRFGKGDRAFSGAGAGEECY